MILRLFLALLLAALPGAALAAEPTPVERHGQLRVEGTRIVDQAGKPVTLRGMSLFWSQWIGKYYNADVVRWLRDDWRATVVRAAVAVEPDGIITHPEREYAKAKAVIDAAIATGLYVVVDWHQHQPRTDAALAFFERIARDYGDKPNVIYEPWNEPLPEHRWTQTIKPYHQAVIARIRAHDPDNLIVAGTGSWSQDVDVAAADPLGLPNVAYTLHFYAGTHRQELRNKGDAAIARGAALFVTEWGTTAATGDDVFDPAETRLWWAWMEERGLSHLNWSIADKDETSAALLPGASVKGGWPERMLSTSGQFVRDRLRQMNPPPAPD